ncbi:hypothetical protein ACH47Z_43595 [Streptomyces sp. NPDC020192]|uniref:hypothetical protein n=1 Tax=Streptomyces sp. NPDC020192 TaxID=3365066 RepID=UPI0037885529
MTRKCSPGRVTSPRRESGEQAPAGAAYPVRTQLTGDPLTGGYPTAQLLLRYL